jgi:radical SAM protein with 4Fe4S-binding SPASM domain
MDNQKLENPGDKVSKSFCVLPWIHLNTWPNGNVYPCCLTDWREEVGNLKDNTLEEIWNNDSMKSIRKDMLSGDKHNSCRKCYQQEENGLDSTRTSSNRWFEKHIPTLTDNTSEDGHNDDFKLLYWDFRFSNLCNMKCRMCGSFLSSKWYEDEVKLYGGSPLPKAIININDYSKKDINLYLDEFVRSVEEIYFAGGEPLLMEEHYYILQKLVEVGNTNLRLRYNTNLGYLKFKQYDNLELWKPFIEQDYGNVTIFASIDGYGDSAEYSRKGTKWNVIEDNIKKCLDANINFHVSCTTNIFNVLQIPDFIEHMKSLGVPHFNIHLNNVLTNPHHYHINILPDSLKQEVKKRYIRHLKSLDDENANELRPKYESIFNFLDEPLAQTQDQVEKALKYTTELLDDGREEKFRFVDINPEYAEWYNAIPHDKGLSMNKLY